MALNQPAVWVLARASHTSSVRPARVNSATKRVARFATSSSMLPGTMAKTRARFCSASCRLLRRSRRAHSRASASEKFVDCAATASNTPIGISSNSLSRSANTVALRCSFSNQAVSPTSSLRSISAVKRAIPRVLTPSRPLATRYTPSGVDPDSNSKLPAGKEKCTAPAASASRVAGSTSARSAQSRRQSMARRISCAALDCSSSSAIRQLAAANRCFFSRGAL